ncbi:Crp/Fnr family transcriptional regulator [Belliella sp. DSM 111904]|uniref:Crp/Fnr family transcriptional regulator n=1 Tax=Belliella filtrata TaxID=2923435 RepID=A0ABS9UVJ6_9BACT|nr:Crp/Fnr family transcriptional regulator [Belliella filtrata]MCH7407785.1 Crp/Fnr family transcriptional regulator [Belliella filtrata]
MHPLLNYISQYVSTLVSDEDFEVILSHFSEKTLRKRQYFLEEGEICKHMAFIVKGAMRKYYMDEKGTEHVIDLYIENWWAGDRESFVMQTPSIYFIDAWEDCEMFLISRQSVTALCEQCPAFNEFILKLDERNSIASQKRITYSVSFNAEKRYQFFLDSHPYFVDRFPQHVVASYLGITKDTLSRIRRKMLRN